MEDQIFKYNLNNEIGKLPKKYNLKFIKGILKVKYGVSESTFDRDRNLLLEDETYIPSDRLDIYCLLLNTSQADLKNYKIEGKSLFEIEKEEKKEKESLRKSMQIDKKKH